jgi:hypothetical protein
LSDAGAPSPVTRNPPAARFEPSVPDVIVELVTVELVIVAAVTVPPVIVAVDVKAPLIVAPLMVGVVRVLRVRVTDWSEPTTEPSPV